MMTTRRWMAFLVVVASTVGAVGSLDAQEKGLLFAHRGGSYEFEENTMEGFRACYEKGLRGFETDVRMTTDGHLVILHDDSLDRTHNATGPVEHKTAAELRAIRTKKKGQPFLFLDELLTYLDDKPGVYLELEMKTSKKELYPDARLEEYCRKLYDTARSREPKGSFYVLTSFDERPLRIVKRLDANADLMLITGGPCCPEIVERAQALGVKRIGCRMEETSRASVRAAQKAGLRVTGWPGQSLQDYHLALGLGVDAICTDIPIAIQTWKAQNEGPRGTQQPMRLSVGADNHFARTTIDLGMVVSDIDKSVAFYTQAVGLKEVPGFQATGQFTGDAGLTDNQPANIRVLVLGDDPTATRLKLMAMPATEPKQGDTRFIHSEFGYRYITIRVKDMTAAVARLHKAGVKPLAKCPLALPTTSSSESYLTVFRDPDGNFVELVGPKQK